MFLAAVLMGASAAAQPADTAPTPTANAPQNGSSDQYPWWTRDQFDRAHFTNESASHYILSHPSQAEPSFVFFPPVPPPLGSDAPLLASISYGKPAPPELAPFVNEFFYPTLADRLAANDLPKNLRAQLQAYRAAKAMLQDELRSRISALKDADPMARERELTAFAALQAPRIANTWAAAERLRADLRRTGIFGLSTGTDDSGDIKSGHLPPTRDTPSVSADLQLESEAMRGAAFYQDGLSTSQRQLLREAAIELDEEAGAAQPATQANPEGRLLFFSPETARIRIPAKLPAQLDKRIADYVASKNRLKAELLNAIRGNNGTGNARAEAFKRLAAAEAPPLAAIEAMAEAIRRDLADLPDPAAPPAALALPPDLAARISVYRRHKVELLKTLSEMLAAPANAPGPAQPRGDSKAGDPGASAMEWLRDGTTAIEVQPSGLKVAVADFDRVQRTLIAELNREQAGIRAALAEYVRSTNRPTDRKSVNDLLNDFEEARQKQEVWDRYHDYQSAVLMPGLSPEQRRLLFDAAVVELGLPLPAGESAR